MLYGAGRWRGLFRSMQSGLGRPSLLGFSKPFTSFDGWMSYPGSSPGLLRLASEDRANTHAALTDCSASFAIMASVTVNRSP